MDQTEKNIYSFDYQYWYWNDMNNMPKNSLIIPIKYKSLKNELFPNEINTINNLKLSLFKLLNISNIYHKMNNIKQIYMADYNNRGSEKHNIIAQTHLISFSCVAILIYLKKNLYKHIGKTI